MDRPEKLYAMFALLEDKDKWQGVFFGMFHYSIAERQQYWTHQDDVEFYIANLIKNLMQ